MFAPLLTAVGEQRVLMISRDAVEAFGDDGVASDNEAAIGTGGMQYVSREPDVLTVLERNPNYFRDPLPYIDGLRANWNADGAYRAAQYVAGEADFTFLPWLGYPGRERGRAGPGRRGEPRRSAHATRPGRNSTHSSTPRSSPTPTRACASPCISPPTGNSSSRWPRRLAADRRADLPRGRAIRVERRRAPPTARLPLRRPARGGPGRGPAAARRQRLRPRRACRR